MSENTNKNVPLSLIPQQKGKCYLYQVPRRLARVPRWPPFTHIKKPSLHRQHWALFYHFSKLGVLLSYRL